VFSRLAGVEVCSSFDQRHMFRPGEAIRLAPRPEHVHLFDAASGNRL